MRFFNTTTNQDSGNKMPGVVSVSDFVRETRDDFASPTTSEFVKMIPQCKETVNKLEEALSSDRDGLAKLKTCVKDMHKTGNSHLSSEMEFSKALDRLGETALDREDVGDFGSDDIGTAFKKFSVVTKELSNLMKNLMQSLDSIILFPVDRLLKTELRGSKGDLKRPFDRSWKDYNDKYSELERQKKKQAKEAGLHRSELTAGEIAEEMEKERKYLQLSTTDYLLRINDVRSKKGVDLLDHLLEYHKAQNKYFTEGLQTINCFGEYIEDLTSKMADIRKEEEEEKRDLVDVRNMLKNSPGFSKVASVTNNLGYRLHQAKGDASAGNKKVGYLNKRSEGRLRNVWQKRQCHVREGFLEIYHADEAKPPTRVNLLTCQMKRVQEDRLCFDVVSYNRTYHFQAESEIGMEEWMSVLLNSKDGALNQAFQDNGQSSNTNQSFLELRRTLVTFIRGLPGNDKCCDCGSQNDATWLSTNFGVIVCIECSGIHREMGVHISKIQSLTLDNIGTSQLLVARVMTNDGFNKIMEARATSKPNPSSTMDERKAYIKAKYEDKKFVDAFCSNSQEILLELEAAVEAHSIYDVLQCFCEASAHGVDLTDPLPSSEYAETCLHKAISHENGNSLHIVDFLVQNSLSLDKQTREGNTPLHYCVIQDQTESMRLLLRSGANPSVENNNGKSPLNIAKERSHHLCEEMLLHALQRKKTMFDNVNIDWHISHDDGSTDFSDDETLDDHPRVNGNRTPEKNLSSPLDKMGTTGRGSIGSGNNIRPLSVYNSPNNNISGNKGDWALDRTANTSDWSRSTPSDHGGDSPGSYRIMPPPPPPSNKKPSLFSGSNLASHMVGSLKKGSKQSMSLPSTAYNTLPAHVHHMRSTTSSPRVIAGQSGPQTSHKRSPSSDSGTGSNTPVSSYHSGKIPHTVYLHVGPKSGGSSDTSPPMQSFAEESSPENRVSPPSMLPGRIVNGQSTESLDSLSDESGGVQSRGQHNNRNSSSGDRGLRNVRNPVPPPRKRNDFGHGRRCRALYDCEADNDDELTFEEGDIIVILNEDTEDENWMEGCLLTDHTKRGLFPVSFVHMLADS